MARQVHDCEQEGCPARYERIQPGDTYYVHTATPDHDDLGNLGWLRFKECEPCHLSRQPQRLPEDAG